MMKKVLLLTLLSLILVLTAIEQELLDEEIEAQKDMMAFMQYTACFRYGDDLKVGDMVVYAPHDCDDVNVTSSMEVIDRTEEEVWVLEKIDGNDIYICINPETKKLKKIWGYDELGNKHEPTLISDNEVTQRVSEMMMEQQIMNRNQNLNWVKTMKSETREIENKSISVNEISASNKKMVYSNEIPKLIPFDLSIELINEHDDIPSNLGGFVENEWLKLVSFTKGE